MPGQIIARYEPRQVPVTETPADAHAILEAHRARGRLLGYTEPRRLGDGRVHLTATVLHPVAPPRHRSRDLRAPVVIGAVVAAVLAALAALVWTVRSVIADVSRMNFPAETLAGGAVVLVVAGLITARVFRRKGSGYGFHYGRCDH